jgi:hypothetical protein
MELHWKEGSDRIFNVNIDEPCVGDRMLYNIRALAGTYPRIYYSTATHPEAWGIIQLHCPDSVKDKSEFKPIPEGAPFTLYLVSGNNMTEGKLRQLFKLNR